MNNKFSHDLTNLLQDFLLTSPLLILVVLSFRFFSMNSKSPIFTAQSDVALRIHVDRAVRHYFAQLQGEQPSQVYDLVLAEMEKPLLSVVLEYTRGNQTRAAEILGLNRGTLRKKLKAHGLMSE